MAEDRTLLEHVLDHGDAAVAIADTAAALVDRLVFSGARDGVLAVGFTEALDAPDAREAHRLLTKLKQQTADYRERFGVPQ